MENKQLAPVVIPTLNRYEHFKRCLESLEKCTLADKTDVFVALDFPPSNKYVDGWRMIDVYLKEKEQDNGFRNLFVIRRERNYGISAPENNYTLLLKEVSKSYNYYIFSEDDNEFSPNFLEYINKGLSLYENDPRIMSICGYSYKSIKDLNLSTNVVALRKCAAWGIGLWFSKPCTYQCFGPERYRDSILKSWKKSMKLLRIRPYSLNTLLSMKFRDRIYGDSLRITEQILEDKFSIFPTISKVRNYGCDGSGAHSGVFNGFDVQEIDNDEHFEYSELTYVDGLTTDYTRRFPVLEKTSLYLVAFMRYISFRLFKKDVFSFYFERENKLM